MSTRNTNKPNVATNGVRIHYWKPALRSSQRKEGTLVCYFFHNYLISINLFSYIFFTFFISIRGTVMDAYISP